MLTIAARGDRRRCGRHGARQAHDAEDVDVEDALPLVDRVLLDRALRADAGVVDQHVDAAEVRDRRGDGGVDATPGR